jgi:hypothetical protein
MSETEKGDKRGIMTDKRSVYHILDGLLAFQRFPPETAVHCARLVAAAREVCQKSDLEDERH